MPENTTIEGDYAALNEFIVNCKDFGKLESLLGGFNLFRVLAFEYGEIRHSNVLAWILSPSESHGLDSTFLQKWLLRVIHEASGQGGSVIAPIDIDAWQLVDVEVRREWQNIDLLLILKFAEGHQWIVCIENKINSVQHSNQLDRYRKVVEQTFPSAARRLFLFLTRSNEVPEDKLYLPASYTQVYNVLKECLESKSHTIGSQPKVLLENYLRLLEEKFMDESDIARTALLIYQKHRRALDVLFEHRPDNLRKASDRIRKLLEENAAELGIVMEPCTKSTIRFIPSAWNQAGNTHGEGWSGSTRTVLFEMNLTGKRPYLSAISGKAPDDWIATVWERSGSPPFRRRKLKTRPDNWCYLHTGQGPNISLEDVEELEDPNSLAQKIYDWAVHSYQEADTKEVVAIIAAELPKLDAIFSKSGN